MSFDTQFGSNATVFSELSPTLKSTQQQPSVFTGVIRRMTVTECERLMGWPEGHTATTDTSTAQSAAQRIKQCGNGVATPVAQWIAQKIREIL